MSSHLAPDASPVHVLIGGHRIPCRPVTFTVLKPIQIHEDGTVNDEQCDCLGWRAEYEGRVSTAFTPWEAARMALGR